MSKKHTPGPLKAERGYMGANRPWFIVAAGHDGMHVSLGENIPGVPSPESKAYAHLFADAPAMLDALKLYHSSGEEDALLAEVAELLRVWADYYEELHKRHNPSVKYFRERADQLMEKHEAACAAIARAEAA